MNWKKKLLALGLSLALTLSLTACGQKAAESEQPEEPAQTEEPAVEAPDGTEADTAHFRIAALKGPTAMGLVKLMKDNDETIGALLSSAKPYEGEVGNLYTFTLAGSADEVTPALIKGDLDMACVPANLAAVLYGKTNGAVEVLAVNTLGVLYIVENGGTVQSMADLKGQTIVAAGKGSTPEYALRYLLTENGIDPDKDVTIDWKSEHSECVAALASGQASIALLPQPFVTVAQNKIEGLRMALDLTAEWDKLDNGSGLITGVIVARRDVVEANPGGQLPPGLRRQRGVGQRQQRGRRPADRGVRHHRGRPCGGNGPALLQHRLHHRQRDEGQTLRLFAGPGRRGAFLRGRCPARGRFLLRRISKTGTAGQDLSA